MNDVARTTEFRYRRAWSDDAWSEWQPDLSGAEFGVTYELQQRGGLTPAGPGLHGATVEAPAELVRRATAALDTLTESRDTPDIVTRQYVTADGRRFPYFPVDQPTGYIARYARYMTMQEYECESELAALRFLIHGEERGELSSEGIYAPDGTRLMDKDAILEAWDDWDDDADAPILEGEAVDASDQRELSP